MKERERESLGEEEREAKRLGKDGGVAVGAPMPEFYHGRERKGESGEKGEKIDKQCFRLGHLAQPH